MTRDAPSARRTLSNGLEAALRPDAHGLVLVIDGIEQSHLGVPGAPPRHASHRWMLAASIAALGARTGAVQPGGEPHPGSAELHPGRGAEPRVVSGATALHLGGGAAALHLGGGAAALPRALQHAVPGLRQRVVELEPALVDLVAEGAPLPPGIEVVVGDGRAVLERVPSPVALVTIDVFGAGSVPAAFTTVECFAAARASLAPGGTLVVNTADGPPLRFVRSQVATLQAVFAHVALISTGSTLAGARHSNLVLVASDAPLPVDDIRERVRVGPPPAAVVAGRRLARFAADTAPQPVRDATAVDSPAPVRSAYLGSASLPPSLTDPTDD
ncbi:spermidine synthase [Agrococcus jenensis]|uniref:Spermidine synthase n=1 Tax=Agrococcus jenensis TaxID=46353 RepID=A0A3N2AT80_9MICO|nr:fused MFS/spermidine synthase [Agrococcus jenensis]ROR65972.1 hypothetical protein EDD26_1347 [Agrococcus jenensis]